MVGILVHGNNHFILSGPLPDERQAVTLARHWAIVEIGVRSQISFSAWQIRSEEFRENLEWAAIVPGDRDLSAGVVALLEELAARGVVIRKYQTRCW
jgi:hypothetical protein